MKRITVLDVETSNKIAAGEVIERPLSVVKELVENSIDSGAKNITIELMDGGEKIIRIIDDGCGIDSEDAETAFLPHATSKIHSIDDLFKIKTLGFRGEALPSIAAISKVKLITKTEEDEFGTELQLEGGKVISKNQAGFNKGTLIEVADLFYNVPARKKFLKSNQREASLINDIVSRIALAHPEISFKLYNNNKLLLNTIGSNNAKDTVLSIYGKNTVSNISEFEGHCDIASIYGFIGNQELSRGSRNNQSVFINGRYIKNKMIATAVENAVKSFFMINKFPFFILYLDIFPDIVDVNVHPTKAEVKFQEERTIFKLVFDTIHSSIRDSIKESLQKEEEKQTIEETNFNYENFDTIKIPIDLKRKEDQVSTNDFRDNRSYNSAAADNYKVNDYKADFNLSEDNNKTAVSKEGNVKDSQTNINFLSKASCEEEIKSYEYKEESSKERFFSNFRVIGQLDKTYILLEGNDGLYVLDQHAAHEKIIFSKYLKQLENQDVSSQILLSPQVVELSSHDFQMYLENKEIFDNTGFKIELFGDNTINIREVPILLGKPEVRTLFLDILDNLRNLGSGSAVEVKYNKIASLACKSAVKAKDELKDIEIKSLISSLDEIEDPFNCPHGRPTLIKITFNELEKRFKRIV